MGLPQCEHFEGSGGRDGFCVKNKKKIQLLKADTRPCPNSCEPEKAAPAKKKKSKKKPSED